MRIDGRWLVCDDGVRRPVISGEIRAADGSWEKSEFLEALDISVLGRDITGLFAVIVDWPRDVVCLVGQRHRYTIEQD